MMIEAVLLYCLAAWFAFFLINHAEMFDKVRAAAMPALPRWISYPLACSFCFTFWTLAAFSLLAGSWTPLMLYCPPISLLIELTYQRLKAAKS